MGWGLDMISRIHNSETPIKRLKKRFVEQTNISNKPEGFWYGINFSWFEFCRKSELGGWIGNFNYLVDTSQANILKLYSEAKMLEFTERYNDGHGIFTTFIDWVEVSKYYDGIEISKYFPHLANDSRTNWFHGWDCASGCIWNLKNVYIKPLTVEEIYV